MVLNPDTALFEQSHVHEVYEQIAHDFSRTRHTCWPFVEQYLEALPSCEHLLNYCHCSQGSSVLDAGCGNGKYLSCGSVLPHTSFSGAWSQGITSSQNVKVKKRSAEPEQAHQRLSLPPHNKFMAGYDMSNGLLSVAKGKGHEVVKGDCFDMSCWRRGSFDHAISIATIHHFSTHDRRVESVKQLLLAVTPSKPSKMSSSMNSVLLKPPVSNSILIVVWALEQDPSLAGVGSARRGKKGAIPISSSEVVQVDEQDVFVPWELQGPKQEKKPKAAPVNTTSTGLALMSPETAESSTSNPTSSILSTDEVVQSKPVYNRYYHLFRQYELSSLVKEAANSLGAEFSTDDNSVLSALSSAELSQTRADQHIIDVTTDPVDSWKLLVTLVEERWERENWVAVVSIKWFVPSERNG